MFCQPVSKISAFLCINYQTKPQSKNPNEKNCSRVHVHIQMQINTSESVRAVVINQCYSVVLSSRKLTWEFASGCWTLKCIIIHKSISGMGMLSGFFNMIFTLNQICQLYIWLFYLLFVVTPDRFLCFEEKSYGFLNSFFSVFSSSL